MALSAASFAFAAMLVLGDWPVLTSPNPRDADEDAFLPLALKKVRVMPAQEVCLGVSEGVGARARDPSEHVLDEAARGLAGRASLRRWSECRASGTIDSGAPAARIYLIAEVLRPRADHARIELRGRCGLLCGYSQVYDAVHTERGWIVSEMETEAERAPLGLSPDTFLQDGWGQPVKALRKRYPDVVDSGEGRWCRQHLETRVCFRFLSGRLAEVEARLIAPQSVLHLFHDAFGPPERVVPAVTGVDYVWKLPFQYDVRVTQSAADVGTLSFVSTQTILWSAPTRRP